MYYEEMVKEAYEEIVGMDKEAFRMLPDGNVELDKSDYSIRDLTRNEKFQNMLRENKGKIGKGLAAGIGTAAVAGTMLYAMKKSNKKEEAKRKEILERLNNADETTKAASVTPFDDFIKFAASTKEVYKTEKTKRTEPYKKGAFDSFRKKTSTYLRPQDYGDEFGYGISTVGIGRRNQTLTADTDLRDVIRLAKKTDDEKQEYKDRVNPHIAEYMSVPGWRMIKKYRRGKAVVNALTDDERDALVSLKHSYADSHTNHPDTASRLRATNTYYY